MPSTPYSDMKNRPLNRHSLLNSSTRMYCAEPACKTLRAVIDFFHGSQQVRLECGHRRRAIPTPLTEQQTERLVRQRMEAA